MENKTLTSSIETAKISKAKINYPLKEAIKKYADTVAKAAEALRDACEKEE